MDEKYRVTLHAAAKMKPAKQLTLGTTEASKVISTVKGFLREQEELSKNYFERKQFQALRLDPNANWQIIQLYNEGLLTVEKEK
jgi:hypothetical protein